MSSLYDLIERMATLDELEQRSKASAPSAVRGPELRAQRVLRSLRAADVAAAMRVSRELVSAIERKAFASERDVARYVAGLRRIDAERKASA